jgi:hypothetical protein
VGLFGNSKRIEAHRAALERARQLVAKYGKDFSRVPSEFHIHLSRQLENLKYLVENTSPDELGGDSLRELAEDLTFAEMICSGRYSFETRQNSRTFTLEKRIETLKEILSKRPWTGPLPSLFNADNLESHVAAVSEALEWFASDIPPRSGKVSRAEASRVIDEGKAQLAAMRAAPNRARPGASVPQRPAGKTCPSCAFVNDADAAFCNGCGRPIPTGCSCGVTNKPGAAFCKGCGAALAR